MWKFINASLLEFKGCFSRQAAFKWFIVVVVGLMVRTDQIGVTSILRTLGINPCHYESLIYFFHSDAWSLEAIKNKWVGVVAKSALIYRICDKPLLIGDGVKTIKEARKMPCVKKLVQESENSAKPQYMHGHMFGAIGILLGTPCKRFCTFLSMRLHDGNEVIGQWSGDKLALESHVVRLIHEACRLTTILGPCLLALDRYFLTVPLLTTLNKYEQQLGAGIITIVTKAKKNVVTYEKPVVKSGKGRPRKKGPSVKLKELFVSESASFRTTTVNIYGRREEVKFVVKDLLWGNKLYRELRFVLVKYAGTTSILVSTDTTLAPESIIEIYALRFKIETGFRELKQVIAGFAYHFWTLAMPKLNRFAKNDAMNAQISVIQDKKKKIAIINAFNAIEGFAMFALIALGLLQMSALRFGNELDQCVFRWLRTKRNNIPSEATTADFLRKTIFHRFLFPTDLPIMRFIQTLQISESDGSYDSFT